MSTDEDHVGTLAGEHADHVRHGQPPVRCHRLERDDARLDAGRAELGFDVTAGARALGRSRGARADRDEALEVAKGGGAIEVATRLCVHGPPQGDRRRDGHRDDDLDQRTLHGLIPTAP